jgi:hypothetical protein
MLGFELNVKVGITWGAIKSDVLIHYKEKAKAQRRIKTG